MTDTAPERIWADRSLIYPSARGRPGSTEYIRADLVEAEISQMKMKNAQAFSAGWDAALNQGPGK